MTEAADPLPAESGAPPAVDWEACLATHRTSWRKVILARTGEAQAVDEVFQEVALAAVEQRSPPGEGGAMAPPACGRPLRPLSPAERPAA